MTVTLSPDTVAKARKLADREGKSLDVVVNEILEEILDLPGMLESESPTAPDNDNNAANRSGKPLSVYLAEQRRKYGYPDDWPGEGAATEVDPGFFVPANR